jgi:hypothetical protein
MISVNLNVIRGPSAGKTGKAVLQAILPGKEDSDAGNVQRATDAA